MHALKSHLTRWWHVHLSVWGLGAALLILTAGGSAALAFHFHGGFRPGRMAPVIHFGGPFQALPDAVSLAANLTRLHDQGWSNSCVGQTLSTIEEVTQQERNHRVIRLKDPRHPAKTIEKAVRMHHPWKFSPGFIYDQVNRGRDQGTTFEAAFGVLITQGDARMRDFPHDGQDWWARPADAARAAAWPYRFSSWRSILPWDRVTIEYELSQGRPIAVAFPVHDTFYSHHDCSPLTGDSGAFHFWHVVTGIGYDQTGLRFVNSWGNRWGCNGQATATWQYLATSGAAIAIAHP